MSEFVRHLAIVIGIDQYDGGIAPLQSAANDATAMAQLLKEKHNYQVRQRINKQATRAKLKHLIEDLLPKIVAEGDRLLFYFAGHGIALNGEDGPEGYLIPQDARLGEVERYLSMSDLNTALAKLPCRHFLAILDCCFAGAFRWSSNRDVSTVPEVIHKERYDRFIQDPAWQAITSAAHDEKAADLFMLRDRSGSTKSHSPFAAALMEALSGRADSNPPARDHKPAGDGVITATELYMYLRDEVARNTENSMKRQTPGLWSLKNHDKGEYIFLAPGHELNLPSAPPLDAAKNPYRGLAAFEEKDSGLFFGRSNLTKRLQEFVVQHSLTVVLGASGSGKSSLVKAGLIPHLKQLNQEQETQERWRIFEPIRLGEFPLTALQNAVKNPASPLADVLAPEVELDEKALVSGIKNWAQLHPDTKLLLVIDQFEELITLCRDDVQREQFLKLLAHVLNSCFKQIHLLVTLRSDFEPQFRSTALENYWKDARFVVAAMSREELREAIEEPASLQVMHFEPHNLVEQLIDEVAQMPGALPLLSFSLSELYLKYLQRQEQARNRGESIARAITQQDYDELGSVTRSLTERADQEYAQLVRENKAYEQTIRNVMLRMVSVGGELARRRVPLSEFKYPESENERVRIVLERFEKARLLTPGIDSEGQPYQEPAHDALVRGWKRLLNWRQQYLSALILHRELTSDAHQWEISSKKKRDSGLLWIEDPRLPTALQLSCGKAYKDNWINLFRWRFSYQAWQSQSRDCWFNKSESDFIRQSFHQRFKRFGQTTLTIAGVILVLSVITIDALQRATIAQLREQSARVLSFLPTANAVEGLVLAIDTMNQSRSISALETTAQSSLLNAVQVSQEVNRLQGHKGSVSSVAFSRDGKRIVSGSSDGTVRLWDAQTGQQIGPPLKGHRKTVDSVAISPDGKRIVSGNNDGTLQLWDAQTGQQIGSPLKGHGDRVISVAFSRDGKRIVSGSWDGTVRLWDAQTGQQIGSPLKGRGDGVMSVAISPDGKRVSSITISTLHSIPVSTLQLWNAQTGQQIGQPLKFHVVFLNALAFSPDGKRIVMGQGSAVQLWDAQTGQQIGQPLRGDGNQVISVAFSPDGQRIVSGSDGGTLQLWDAQTGQQIGPPLQGHRDRIYSVAFSPDGQRIVSGSDDGTLQLSDAQTGQSIRSSLKGHGRFLASAAFSPDGQRIVSGSKDMVQLWDAQTGQQIGPPLKGHRDYVLSVAFSPDGQRIVSGSKDMTVRLWDAQTGQQSGPPLQGLKGQVYSVAFSPDGQRIVSRSDTLQLWDAQTGQSIGPPLQGLKGQVYSVAFSPDGKRIVSRSEDDTLQLWDAQTGQSIGPPLQGHGKFVYPVAFSLDGKRIVSRSEGDTLQLWDAQTGQSIGPPLQGHKGSISSVDFSPDGQRIVSVSDDGTGRLWDAQTRQQIGPPLQGHRKSVDSVAFSPDGKRIVSDSEGDTLQLWDAQTGQSIRTPLQGHKGSISSMAFSPDGQRIVSGSHDGTLQLWDAQTGQLIGPPLKGHRERVFSVDFSPDGQRIVSGSDDETVLWDVSPEGLLALACDRLRYHPLLNQPEKVTTDSESLKVSDRAKSVCQQQVWKQRVASSQRR
jgi:WD40 repeat protein